jgi:hypothetical protein
MQAPSRARTCTFVTLSLLFAAAAILLTVPVRAAGDAAAEIKTASTHAGLAAKAPTVEMVHMHLHHTVNCLEGPKGDDFSADAGNPCAQQGNGAIPDSTDKAQQKALQDVVAKAKAGIAESDLTAAKKTATEVGSMLAAVGK